MFFSRNGLVLDHPVSVGTTGNGPYYCSLLQDKVRPALRHKQPELLEGVAILQFATTQLLIAIVMCKIWYNIGAEKCWHILPTLQISPHVITGCFHV
jgi:hypothetical protein